MTRTTVMLSMLVAVLLAGCAPEGTVETSAVDAATRSIAERPAPRIRIDSSAGVIPSRILVDLGAALFEGDQIGEAPGAATRWRLEPEVDAVMVVDSPTSLAVIPDKAFELGTTYVLSLDSLESRGETIEPEDHESWVFEFTTPPLGFVQMVPVEIDPRTTRTTVDLVFSAPVDASSVAERAVFVLENADGRRHTIRRVRWLTSDPDSTVRATISGVAGASMQILHLAIEPGVQQAGGEAVLGEVATQLELRRDPLITIRDVRPVETGAGFALEIVCHDASVEELRYYWDPQTRRSYSELSRRCRPQAEAVAGLLRLEPEVRVTMSPSGGGFRLTGDFRRGTYKLILDGGLTSVDGGVLPSRYETSVTIPPRSPRVRILAEGRYLPRSAWTSLAIRHLNVSGVELSVRRVPPENLVFWMSDDNETATVRTSDLVARHSVSLSAADDEEATTFVDLTELLPASTRGLLELRVQGAGAADAARILLTDLQVVAKRAGDASGNGPIEAWVLDSHSLRGVAGADVSLIRPSGTEVASCTTGFDGGCRIDPGQPGLDGTPPFALLVTAGGDLTYLKFAELEEQVQEARVSGEAYAGAGRYRAAVYTDRGAYRPGETVHLSAILRDPDHAAPPEGMPVVLDLIDPRGRVVAERMLETNPGGLCTVDLPFETFATTGRYQANVSAADRVVGSTEFQVEDFVPERMEVEVNAAEDSVVLGSGLEVVVVARYLFGGVPEGNDVQLICTLEPAAFTADAFPGFHFGPLPPEGAPRPPTALGTAVGTLDGDGAARIACAGLDGLAALDGPSQVVARAAVFESGSGRTTVARATVPLHPDRHVVGLSSPAESIARGREIRVEGVVVDLDGHPLDEVDRLELEVLRVEPEWGWTWDEATGRSTYRSYQRVVPEDRIPVTVSGGRFETTWTPPSGSTYRFRARHGRALAELEVEGNAGWWWRRPQEGGDRTPRPERAVWLDLEAPRQIEVGESSVVRLEAPWRGRLLFTVETDSVLSHRWQWVEPGEHELRFKVSDFAPNVYVTAFLVKDPHLESKGAFLPDRAFGVSSVNVRPSRYTQPVRLDVPAEVRSQSTLTARLRLERPDEPTWATVAVVDEGVLSLTQFSSPDPFESIFARRALGVKTFETVGWTLLAPDAGSAAGGDALKSGPPPVLPVKPVALWSGIVPVAADGTVEVDFKLPLYQGAVRVMAVTAGRHRIGHAAERVVVRDPLVVQATIPRFLVSGDRAQVPVAVTNTTGGTRKVSVEIDEEPLIGGGDPVIRVDGAATHQIEVAPGRSAVVRFDLVAAETTGATRITVRATSGDVRITDQAEVPLLPAGSRAQRVQRLPLEEGDLDLAPYLEGWAPLTENTTFWVTANPYADVFSHLKHLVRYPYGCIEQTTSTTRPLLYLGHLLNVTDPDAARTLAVDDRVRSGISRILSMQTPSGAFSYWPGGTEPSPWGTAFATQLLLDARDLRYEVPKARLDNVLAWMESELDRGSSADRHYSRNAEPYLHYVLARAGRARKGSIQAVLDRVPAEAKYEEREHRFMLQAALHLAGDRRYEAQLRNPDVTPLTDYRDDGWSFYSDLRMRGFMLSTYVDLFGHDAGGEPLADLVANGLRQQRSTWYTTQELVWGITGLGKFLQAEPPVGDPPELLVSGRRVSPQAPPAGRPASDRTWQVVRASEHDRVVLRVPRAEGGTRYLLITSDGVPAPNATWYEPPPPYGLKLTRELFDGEGNPVAGPVRLGALLYLKLTVRNNAGRRVTNVALVDRVAGGLEIENPRLGREGVPAWIDAGGLWQPDHMNIRDDRLEVFGTLDKGQQMTVVYAVRAVTAGSFTVPPALVEAMYDPRVRDRTDRGRLRVHSGGGVSR